MYWLSTVKSLALPYHNIHYMYFTTVWWYIDDKRIKQTRALLSQQVNLWSRITSVHKEGQSRERNRFIWACRRNSVWWFSHSLWSKLWIPWGQAPTENSVSYSIWPGSPSIFKIKARMVFLNHQTETKSNIWCPY